MTTTHDPVREALAREAKRLAEKLNVRYLDLCQRHTEETLHDFNVFRGALHDAIDRLAMIQAAPPAPSGAKVAEAPIDMVLHCPVCGTQHIDAPEEHEYEDRSGQLRMDCNWTNPPHRSHLCHACEHVWRPADVPTNGVLTVKTVGKNDSPLATPSPSPAAAQVQEAAAWGIYARIDGAWALQLPVYGSEHFARRDIGRFVAGIELDVRPLYDHPLTAQVAERQPLTGWQPIETAPKDGTPVLAYREDWVDCYAVAWWSKGSGEWECSGSQFREASHWLPLPDESTIPASGEAKSHE